jgi:phage N-6-adenine-methyltransferase
VNPALLSSVKHDWRTPDEVLSLVRRLGCIDLDPATAPDNPTGARRFYTAADNGLRQSWESTGIVYCNPPYGRALGPWAKKMRDEGSRNEIVALLPARPDTRWFQEYVTTASALCFWRGRMTFEGAPAPAPFPSVLAYWGDRWPAFSKVFKGYGWIVLPPRHKAEEPIARPAGCRYDVAV